MTGVQTCALPIYVEKETPLIVDFSKDEMEYLRRACEKISDEEFPDDLCASVEAVYTAEA